jgi:hypothetical protein
MGGGLLQLVAYGAQDVYLTGNPQITFFKVVYRRHTNFSIESIQQTFNGNPSLGQRVTCQISRNGDLVHKVYLEANISVTSILQGNANYKALGHRIIKQVELEIGGQMIDRQYGEWMYIWNELSLPKGKKDGFFKKMIGDEAVEDQKVYVPLEFWFCRNIGLALPLIALQYHEVKINITFNSQLSAEPKISAISDVTLWADYIFLDTDERRRFAQLSHEYLIEQVQIGGGEQMAATTSAEIKSKLSFNHPVKELVWVIADSGATDLNWTDFKATSKFKLQLNGNDRFSERDNKYFTYVQPYQHHENIPDDKNIHVYSFALKPEEHQPSGTLNMSRIDTATALVTGGGTAGTFRIYAVNYNVLRILSGMGGLAYSN